MYHGISKRLDLFGDEIFAALNERKVALEAQGRTIYNLSVGTPDFAPAEHIRKAMMDAAADPQNWKYSLRDLPELLDAVCGYYKRRFGVEITPDQVASCAGSQEGVGHIGMVLCDEGDTVLLPTPCYPVFIAGSLLGGAKPWYYPLTKEHGFLPYVKDIPEDVARKAKYMIVSLPANPVGSVGSPELYAELVAFAKSMTFSSSTTTPTATLSLTGPWATASSIRRVPWMWAWSSSACPKASTSPVHASAFLWAGGTW